MYNIKAIYNTGDNCTEYYLFYNDKLIGVFETREQAEQYMKEVKQ